MATPRRTVDVRDYDRTRGGRPEHVRRYTRTQDAAPEPPLRVARRYGDAPLERLAAADYMELRPGGEEGFSCQACAFFDRGFCGNRAIRAPVRAYGCCNLFFPRDPADLTFRARDAEARRIGDALGVDWSAVDPGQFRRGLEVEKEHADVARDELDVGRIALAHLREVPDYYDRLDKYVEGGGA